MATQITSDPAASVSAALPVAAPAVAPGQASSSLAGAPALTPFAVLPAPPSVTVDLSPAAQLLATVAQLPAQLSQLQAAAIDSVVLQSAVDTLAAQPELPPAAAEDPAQQISSNPALAAAIAAYRMQEQPSARPVLQKKGLINPIPALNGEEAVESETDPSVLSEQQQNRQG